MITVRLSGGMGNQMFQYACARALAIRNNTDVCLDTTYLLDRTPRFFLQPNFVFREYDLGIFAIKAKEIRRTQTPLWFLGKTGLFIDVLYRRMCKPRGTESIFEFDEKVTHLKDGSYLSGLWQSEKYFKEYADIIRKDFTMVCPIGEKTKELASDIQKENTLCVHVRRGDFLKHTIHNTTGADYFIEGVKTVGSKTKIDTVYVFSDDLDWCKENLSFTYPTIFVGPQYEGIRGREHFYLMRQCKHFVIANSTFSWWAAWLSENPDKIVVAPQKWFGDSSINTKDIYPSEWLQK